MSVNLSVFFRDASLPDKFEDIQNAFEEGSFLVILIKDGTSFKYPIRRIDHVIETDVSDPENKQMGFINSG